MSSNLAIQDIRYFTATSTISQPIADATHSISDINFVVAEIELANGIVGQGYLLSFHYFPQAILGALKDMRDFFCQFDANETVRMAEEFDKESEYFGQNGLLKWARGIVNIAMWDAWGKHNEQPVWKLLGSSRTEVPVYGSGGWLSYSDDDLINEVTNYKARGFKAVKIKVGASDEGRDMHRLRLVREAVGAEVKIMMDANQGMSVPAALQLSREAESLGIHWFEEPVHHNDVQGFATLREKCGISLAMGEREYDLETFKQLINHNAIDLWQPDILRLGGVEPWRDSAAVAAAHHLPVLPHYYKDYDVPLLCTIPNGYGAESFDWIDEIIDNRMEIVGGMARPRQTPGWGFRFLHDKMKVV